VIIYLNSINKLNIVMVKCGVLFEVRADFLNIIRTSFGFKELKIYNTTRSYSINIICNIIFTLDDTCTLICFCPQVVKKIILFGKNDKAQLGLYILLSQ
jgi:hypothetical protein